MIGHRRAPTSIWGLGVGIVACILFWVLIDRTSFGFAARITGGNIRAAQLRACRSAG